MRKSISMCRNHMLSHSFSMTVLIIIITVTHKTVQVFGSFELSGL